MARRTILSNTGLDPVRKDMRIVNEDGTATDAFLRNLQRQRSTNSGASADITGLSDKVIPVTAPITGGGALGGVIAPIGLADTAVTPGSYTSADITVDAKGRITAAANGSGGGGAYFNGVNGVATGTSTSATASKGTVFTPRVDITVDAVWAVYDSAGAGQSHRCVVADINSVAGGVIGAVTGTTNAYNAIDTNVRAVRFDFATPITMLAGVPYIICLTNASGIGTTVCRVGDIAQSATSMSAYWALNAPGDSAIQVHDYASLTLAPAQAPSASNATVQHTLWLEGTF